MILIDQPVLYKGRPGICRGYDFTSSHMISDLEGPSGTRELMEMAKKLGLKAEWLQKAGTHREHFDIMNSVYQKALDAGAHLVQPMQIVDVMIGKTWKNEDYVQRIMEEMQKAGFWDQEIYERLLETERHVLRDIWRNREQYIAKIAEHRQRIGSTVCDGLYDIPFGCICLGDGLMGMKCEAPTHAVLRVKGPIDQQ